jgi:hypothetical protein
MQNNDDHLLNMYVKRILHDIKSMGAKSILHCFCLWWYHNKSINIDGDIENTLLCAQNVTNHKTAYHILSTLQGFPFLYCGKAIHGQAWTGPEGSNEVQAPRFHYNWHMKVVRLSALCTFTLHEIFLVLILGRG